jgi:hypothetical protein
MHIIFGDDVAEEISKKHIVLQLETFRPVGKDEVTAYCVVMPESILTEMADINTSISLHSELITNWNNKNYEIASTNINVLRGKFGGSVDSFYDELASRINKLGVTAL